MDSLDIHILKLFGWMVECELPFELRHTDGSIATGRAAKIVLDDCRTQFNDDKE